MKRITLSIILFFSMFFLSCNNFLEEKQVSTLTQDYYNNENGLESLINGLYTIARIKFEWDVSGARLMQAETDGYMTQADDWARMLNSTYGSDNGDIAERMNNFLGAANSSYAPMGVYPEINNCNIALDILNNKAPGRFETDDNFRKQRKSEVLFLRAWSYYMVTNQLGSVPLLLTPRREDDGIYYFPKTSMEVIYKQLISDLRYAFENLPIKSDPGRITKFAAGHLLAKLYLNRAQGAQFQNSNEPDLQMLYKGTNPLDLDSSIYYATQVIDGLGGASGLAGNFWDLFDPNKDINDIPEVIWSAQFDLNTSLNGRFGGNRSANYHTGDYTNQTGVVRSMAYGRPFAIFKPTDWGYDNFRDKANDSRFYKTFEYEYIGNGGNSYTWDNASASWWNSHKAPDQPGVVSGQNRVITGNRALIFIENDKEHALDSAMAMSQPYQVLARWVKSSITGKFYYRLWIDGSGIGLDNAIRNIYLSSKKFVDPQRGGSNDESNFNSEAGTRDAILMRLGETYLIRAEAYGRKGQYNLAVDDINVLRERAAYKAGENRPDVLVNWDPAAGLLDPAEKEAPYVADGSSFAKIKIDENIFTPGTPESLAEGYSSDVTSKEDMFVNFIYNERAREMFSEGTRWEDLHNAGLLYERVEQFNQMASDKQGLWPVSDNPNGGNGQNGNGKGLLKRSYSYRPWPDAYLSLLTDSLGNTISSEERLKYQNPGY